MTKVIAYNKCRALGDLIYKRCRDTRDCIRASRAAQLRLQASTVRLQRCMEAHGL